MSPFWSRVGRRRLLSLVVADPELKPLPRPPLGPVARMVYDLQMDMIRRLQADRARLAAGGEE